MASSALITIVARPYAFVPSDPERRPKETDAKYTERRHRWRMWLAQEPCVNLWSVSETEVAEYRAWAGTTAYHNRVVAELVAIAEGRN